MDMTRIFPPDLLDQIPAKSSLTHQLCSSAQGCASGTHRTLLGERLHPTPSCCGVHHLVIAMPCSVATETAMMSSPPTRR